MEDNIIAGKLAELNTLPEGYEPNLDSKWALLEAGINKRDTVDKRFMYLWMSIAASLFIVCVLGIWSYMQPKRVIVQKKVQPKIQFSIQQELTASSDRSKKEIHVWHKVHVLSVHQFSSVQKSTQLKAELPLVTAEALSSCKDSVSVIQESAVVISATLNSPLKIKKPRYVQVDFNTPIIDKPQPSEEIAFSGTLHIKFHIGTSVNTESGTTKNDYLNNSSTFQFQKNF